MSSRFFAAPACASTAAVLSLLVLSACCHAEATPAADQPFVVRKAVEQLELTVQTSRIVRLDKQIPRLVVQDPKTVKVTPISATDIRVTALQPGVTQIRLLAPDEQVYTVDVTVYNSGAELELLLRNEFPTCDLRIQPLGSSVVVSGSVDHPEKVNQVIRMGEDYYPKVIPNITVTGVQTVLLHVRIFEISKSRLEQLDVDYDGFNGVEFAAEKLSQAPAGSWSNGETSQSDQGELRFGTVADAKAIHGWADSLADGHLIRKLANPTLSTTSGRPASFKMGGELAVPAAGMLGTAKAVEFMPFGTRVDFVPVVLGNGSLRLEARPQWSEVEQLSWEAMAEDGQIPQESSVWADVAIEIQFGHTLVIWGLAHQRVDTVERGIPWLSELPWAGPAFRRKKKQTEEVEMLITVSPELVDPVQRPAVLPCTHDTTNTAPNSSVPTGPPPTDAELYWSGQRFVPPSDRDVAPAGTDVVPPAPQPLSGGWRPKRHETPVSPAAVRKPATPASGYPAGR